MAAMHKTLRKNVHRFKHWTLQRIFIFHVTESFEEFRAKGVVRLNPTTIVGATNLSISCLLDERIMLNQRKKI